MGKRPLAYPHSHRVRPCPASRCRSLCCSSHRPLRFCPSPAHIDCVPFSRFPFVLCVGRRSSLHSDPRKPFLRLPARFSPFPQFFARPPPLALVRPRRSPRPQTCRPRTGKAPAPHFPVLRIDLIVTPSEKNITMMPISTADRAAGNG